MSTQLALFAPPVEGEKEEHYHLVAGGIYTEKDPDNVDPLSPYMICFGANAFHSIFDGMDDIDNEVILAYAHHVKLVPGYGLRFNKQSKKLMICNSSIKNKPEYIIWEGHYEDGFVESIKPYLKIFEK